MGSASPSPTTIPIIDFSPFILSTSTPSSRLSTAKELTTACHETGFIALTNHGISLDLLDEAFTWSKKLFDLSMEDKMKAPHPPGASVHRGYSWPGLEKVSQVISDDKKVGEELRGVGDCKESFEIGSPKNEEQPNVYLPDTTLPGFRGFMASFYERLSVTANLVLQALGLGLGLKDPDFLLMFHSGENNQLRLLHYPPVEREKLEMGEVARMPAHSDWGSITLLFQDECGGLEVQDKQGEFVRVRPTRGEMVVNVGDLLMRWSNDYLKSTLHRVTLPGPKSDEDTSTNGTQMTPPRYSIPYFVSPNINAVIECMKECYSEDNPAKYPPVVQRDYRLMRGKLQYRDADEGDDGT